MRWWSLKTLGASAAALVAGVGYAAGKGERMTAPARVAELLADLPGAASKLEPHSPAREAIESGDLEGARQMLSFRPLAEAPVPKGFPEFTPVGVIELKHYPAYRRAVGADFWPLFRHIQTEEIPMTAPVEMNAATAGKGRGEMAFLYQDTSVGELGPIDDVNVEDVPAATVVSLGVRGKMTEAATKRARATLEAWLDGQSMYRQASGESFRVFGYNSPMVPDGQTYWEAQLLLEPTTP